MINWYLKLRMSKLGYKLYLSLSIDHKYWTYNSNVLYNKMNKLEIEFSEVLSDLKSFRVDGYGKLSKLTKYDQRVISTMCKQIKDMREKDIVIKVSTLNPEDFI
ncbi:hypothetical protein [Vibrio phage phiKT1024]|nr:hypothetical protein [Vibrio phage phiKT1024]